MLCNCHNGRGIYNPIPPKELGEFSPKPYTLCKLVRGRVRGKERFGKIWMDLSGM
jgi:hypothetical protein